MPSSTKTCLLGFVPLLLLFTGSCKPVDDGEQNPGGLPLPPGCPAKSVKGGSVTSNEQLDALDGATRIDGDLSLSGDVSSVASLSCLTQITGELRVRSGALTSLPLVELRQVNTINIAESALLEIDFSNLRTIGNLNGESMRFEGLPSLESLKLGALEESSGIVLQIAGSTDGAALQLDLSSLKKAGSLWMRDVRNLETLEGLSGLETVTGELRVERFDRLQDIPLDALQSAGTLLVAGSGALATIDFSNLRTIGNLNGESMRFEGLPSLESLKLGALEESSGIVLQLSGPADGPALELDFKALKSIGGTLYVNQLQNLETMAGFAALTRVVGELVIKANGRLPQCEAEALTNRLATPPAQVTVAANLLDAACKL